jgi:hypothetical protein
MRILLFCILISTMATCYSTADTTQTFEKYSVSFYAGCNFSKMSKTIPQFDGKNRSIIGSSFGVYFNYMLKDYIGISSGIHISQKGERYVKEIYDSTIQSRFVANYLDMPLLAKAHLGKGKYQQYFLLGPVFSYWQSYKNDLVITENKVTIDKTTQNLELRKDVPINYNRFDMGILLGGGIMFKTGPGSLVVDVRYTKGVLNIYKSEDIQPSKNSSIGILLGYQLPINFKK